MAGWALRPSIKSQDRQPTDRNGNMIVILLHVCYNRDMEMINERELRGAIRSNLPRLRHGRNLTQEKLAEQIGVHRVTVARWEAGEVAPSPEALFNLAEALEVSITELGKISENLPVPS